MKKISSFLALMPILFSACTAQVSSVLPAGYSAATAKKHILDARLDEISGIAWNSATGGFVAEEDEEGAVYFLSKDFGIQKKLIFGKPGDYEDIVMNGSSIYVLKSNGSITEMNYNGNGFTGVASYKMDGDKAEYESLVLSPDKQSLVMICKQGQHGKQHNATYGYSFNLQSKTFATDPVFKLKWKDIAAKAGQDLKHFRPSAAAIQPATGNWYLVSSIESLLVVADGSTMDIKSVTHLPRKDFLQPEGITFDNQSNMYITSEAAGASPVLWYFPYQKK